MSLKEEFVHIPRPPVKTGGRMIKTAFWALGWLILQLLRPVGRLLLLMLKSVGWFLRLRLTRWFFRVLFWTIGRVTITFYRPIAWLVRKPAQLARGFFDLPPVRWSVRLLWLEAEYLARPVGTTVRQFFAVPPVRWFFSRPYAAGKRVAALTLRFASWADSAAPVHRFFSRPAVRWFFGRRPKALSIVIPDLSVGVIVPAWNEEKSIGATIQSLLAQTHPLAQIIIVDDFSADRTNEIASWYAARHPNIRVLRPPSNQGSKAMAINFALPYLTTDLFVMVDGDTQLAPDAVRRTLHFFNDPKAAIVCGYVIPQRIRTMWERGRFIEYLYGLTVVKPAQERMRTILVASGCFSVFRTAQVRDEFGGFEKRTIAEDMDYTWKVVAKDYNVYFAPDAVSYPVDPKNRKEMFKQIERWYRGLFQNIEVRGNLFRHNKRLGIVVYFYLIWFAIGPLLMPYMLWLALHRIGEALVFLFLTSFLFVGIPTFYGGWRKGMFWKAVVSFPAYFTLAYFNMGVYLYAAFMELVLKEKLDTWNKGHS